MNQLLKRAVFKSIAIVIIILLKGRMLKHLKKEASFRKAMRYQKNRVEKGNNHQVNSFFDVDLEMLICKQKDALFLY